MVNSFIHKSLKLILKEPLSDRTAGRGAHLLNQPTSPRPVGWPQAVAWLHACILFRFSRQTFLYRQWCTHLCCLTQVKLKPGIVMPEADVASAGATHIFRYMVPSHSSGIELAAAQLESEATDMDSHSITKVWTHTQTHAGACNFSCHRKFPWYHASHMLGCSHSDAARQNCTLISCVHLQQCCLV